MRSRDLAVPPLRANRGRQKARGRTADFVNVMLSIGSPPIQACTRAAMRPQHTGTIDRTPFLGPPQ